MAELDIGQHCQVEHCRQRGRVDSERERERKVFLCRWFTLQWLPRPACCGRRTALIRWQEPDFLPFVCDGCSGIFCLEHRSKESHGCLEITVTNDRLKTDTHKSFPCSFKDCTERELVAVLCPYCEKNFCLRHRHQSDHECEKLEIPKPRMAATQKLVKDIIDSKTRETASKRRKGAKNSETAAKVALMKLKMHADGDKSLPQFAKNLQVGIKLYCKFFFSFHLVR
ncbi:AN1-type zinc finger protein 1 isoform X3 [Oryctolagus cuniculus]|uniref:AN1-type zinc finger protein 1 isoform X3 n=1 Tax=Oryctolagus cuniculus TaxID=9986 RepID=UPI00387927F2